MQRISLHDKDGNVVPFPVERIVNSGLDINAVVTGGRKGFVAYSEDDGYRIENDRGETVWELRRVA